MSDNQIPVLVTTEHRGVFFGYINPEDEENKAKLRVRKCRCAIYWSGERGFLGLASHGPEDGSHIGSEAPVVTLHDITNVARCTDEAVAVWTRS